MCKPVKKLNMNMFKFTCIFKQNFSGISSCIRPPSTCRPSPIFIMTKVNICHLGKQDKTLDLVNVLLKRQKGVVTGLEKKLKDTKKAHLKEISALRQNVATNNEELCELVEKFNELGTRCAGYENKIKDQG